MIRDAFTGHTAFDLSVADIVQNREPDLLSIRVPSPSFVGAIMDHRFTFRHHQRRIAVATPPDRRRPLQGDIVTRFPGSWAVPGTPRIAMYGAVRPGISGIEAQRELGQRRGADVRFRANTGRSSDPRWMSAHSHKRTVRPEP